MLTSQIGVKPAMANNTDRCRRDCRGGTGSFPRNRFAFHRCGVGPRRGGEAPAGTIASVRRCTGVASDRAGSQGDRTCRAGSQGDGTCRAGSQGDRTCRAGSQGDRTCRAGSQDDRTCRAGSQGDRTCRAGSQGDRTCRAAPGHRVTGRAAPAACHVYRAGCMHNA